MGVKASSSSAVFVAPRNAGLSLSNINAFLVFRAPDTIVDWCARPSAIRPALFHFLERARPVGFQQPRQRSVGEQAAAGLAAGAVVRLILGMDDALDRGAARRTRPAEAAMHGHLRPEGRDLLREPVARLLPQAFDPFGQRGAGGGQ